MENVLELNLSDENTRDVLKALLCNSTIELFDLLKEADEKLYISPIADELGYSEAGISALVKRLEKIGLVEIEYADGVHGKRKYVTGLKFDKIVFNL